MKFLAFVQVKQKYPYSGYRWTSKQCETFADAKAWIEKFDDRKGAIIERCERPDPFSTWKLVERFNLTPEVNHV